MRIQANGISIEVEDSGGSGPTVLLTMGLGLQLTAWPTAMVQSLVHAGYRVIRYDNRDIGLSQHFDALGRPNLLWAGLLYKMGFTPKSPYSLHDMACDALGVLDSLQIDTAHVVGVSMGGMIGQRIALAAPHRVRSLTSIMSSSSARGLPPPTPAVMRLLMQRPASSQPHDIATHYVKLLGAIGSPAFPTPEALLYEQALASITRSYRPIGTQRQMLAIAADTSRARALAHIQAPTLVMHGKADPLLPYPCGADTARRIPGARLLGIDGMGHDLPTEVVQQLLPPLLDHLNTSANP